VAGSRVVSRAAASTERALLRAPDPTATRRMPCSLPPTLGNQASDRKPDTPRGEISDHRPPAGPRPGAWRRPALPRGLRHCHLIQIYLEISDTLIFGNFYLGFGEGGGYDPRKAVHVFDGRSRGRPPRGRRPSRAGGPDAPGRAASDPDSRTTTTPGAISSRDCRVADRSLDELIRRRAVRRAHREHST
jgi:hypothetical protein